MPANGGKGPVEEKFGKGNVERIGGLWVLHLKGTSFELSLIHI